MKNTLSARRGIVLSALWLAACGGGGGGSEPPTVQFPTQVRSLPASADADADESNFASIGSSTVVALLTSVGGSTALEAPQSAGSARAPSAGFDARHRIAQGIATWAVKLASARLATAASIERPQAMRSGTLACDASGSYDFTVNDADGNQRLSRGDSIDLQFSACVFFTGDPAANGGVHMDVNVAELDANDVPTALDVSLTMNAFAIDGLGSLSGQARLWSAPEGSSGQHAWLRYTDMQANLGGDVVTLNFDVDEHDSGNSATTRIDGALTLSTGPTFRLVQATGYVGTIGAGPESGTLGVFDVQGDRIDIIARGTLVDLDFYPAGADTPSAWQRGTQWADFGTKRL